MSKCEVKNLLRLLYSALISRTPSFGGESELSRITGFSLELYLFLIECYVYRGKVVCYHLHNHLHNNLQAPVVQVS